MTSHRVNCIYWFVYLFLCLFLVRDLVRQLNSGQQQQVNVKTSHVDTTPTRPNSKPKPPTPQRTTSQLTSQTRSNAVASPLLTQANELMATSERKEGEGDSQTALTLINQAIGGTSY